MVAQPESEFVEFVEALSGAVCSRLKKRFSDTPVEKVCDEFPHSEMPDIVGDVTQDWFNHAYFSGKFQSYDDMVSVFLINLIGPLNRTLPADMDESSEFAYVYLHSLEKVLGMDSVRKRFVQHSVRLMHNRAA